MVNPYVAVGAASRLADLPERIRARRLENENRELSLADRDRRIAREDEMLERDRQRFGRQQKEWEREDTIHSLDLADRMQRDAEHIEDRARGRRIALRDEREHAEDRDYTRRERELGLSEARKTARRSDVVWNRSQEELSRKMREQGMHDMLTALERGADPRIVEREFNARGELGIQPGTLIFDPGTKRISFTDSDGEQFDGSIDQLKAIFVPPKAPIKIGKDDTLIDPSTGQTVAQGPGAAAAERGEGGDGFAKWNRQTATAQAAKVVSDGLGENTELEQFSPTPGLRERAAYGKALAGKVTMAFGSRISPQEAGEIALRATRLLIPYEEARAMASQRGAVDEQDLRRKADEIVRGGRIRAAQELQRLIQEKEIELEQKEMQPGIESPGQSAPAPKGNRPPLSAFEGR